MSAVKRNIRITLIVALIWVAFVLYLTYSRYAGNNNRDAVGTAQVPVSAAELREIGALLYDAPIELRDFTLVDQSGQAFDRQRLQGQWSLIFFGFTHCPDICPLTMHELGGFYRDLQGGPWAEDTQVIMVSVDPFRDDEQAVADYVAAYHEDFVGVVGEFGDIADFARQLYIAHSRPTDAVIEGGGYLIDHSGNILLVNPDGDYVGFMESGIQRPNILRAYNIIRQGGPTS